MFGKTIEKQETQRQYELVNSNEDAMKLNDNPRLKERTMISPSLVLYELVKKKVCLDKPLYIGKNHRLNSS